MSFFIKKTKTLLMISSKKLILYLSRQLHIDLFMLAIRNVGILNSGNMEKTGEKYVLTDLLPLKIKSDNPVLFDVGGNTGEYTLALKNSFPTSTIYSFEPNPKAYQKIIENIKNYDKIIPVNSGLGSKVGTETLYSYSKVENSTLGTLNKSALSELYNGIDDVIEEISFQVDTIDDYCATHNIQEIDFLKIDTEGQELNVLKGAQNMINKDKIKIIQFEFNNFNVYYRVFLKDFYYILKNYDFYRTNIQGLVPLGGYDTINEIFKFQNIIAISKNIADKNKI